MSKLKWEQTSDFEWSAVSAVHDDGGHFEYSIVTCNVDSALFFSAANSSGELISEQEADILFRRLDDAKVFCELLERANTAVSVS